MKIVIIVISIIFFIIMTLLSLLGYLTEPSLVGGSINSMEVLASVFQIVPMGLLLLFGCLLFYYIKKRKAIILFILVISMILWFLSGRVVSIIVWPNARISTGWFYIPTESFDLCNNTTDCETLIDYHTKTENLSFWRIHIKNETTDKTIFVGPFLWNDAKRLFNSKIGTGSYNK